MTQTHPLTPPDELLDQWCITGKSGNLHNALTLAYRAGADQELEACVEWFDNQSLVYHRDLEYALRTARRPKPPSLKEQALEELESISTCFRATHMGDIVCDKIRRALEALPND